MIGANRRIKREIYAPKESTILKKKLVLFMILLLLFATPVIAGIVQHSNDGAPASGSQPYGDEKKERAVNQVITDPAQLKQYAKAHGLTSIPVKIEAEYNGP